MSLSKEFSKARPGDFGVIGDPVAHSLSPKFQNAALKKAKLSATYHRFRVRPAELAKALSMARKLGLRGFNVTIPHKESVVRYMDRLDPLARSLRSVNTVLLSASGLEGFNTDADGFEESLRKDLKFRPRGASVVVLGAGGTGKVAVQTLLKMGVSRIYWWNRSGGKVRAWLQRNPSKRIKNISFHSELTKMAPQADLIVNTTSVGLKAADGLPAQGLRFRKGQKVFDVIYHRNTAFLKKARAEGAHVANGLGMLVYQGARSFTIWTNKRPDIKIMRRALGKFL